ncbi:MAG TPA: HAD family phosphatase [Dongiaceae bacterium]|nr:HAD family phosphatase [Dongiaceae bacterium]
MADFVLLFDLDGTMVDTDRFHLAAYNTLLAPTGRSVDNEYYRNRIMGFPHHIIMADLFPEASTDLRKQLAEKKESIFRDLLQGATPTHGLIEVLDVARTACVPMGVVTNAPRLNADLMLRTLKLEKYFDIVVIGEELPNPKPHPMPYLVAMEALGGTQQQALAFEDSLSGIQSASNAGIETIGIATNLPADVMCQEGASFVIQDFTAPQLWRHLSMRSPSFSLRE